MSKKFKKGDRVRYYGVLNHLEEITPATVLQIKGNLLYLDCDRFKNDGDYYTQGGRQWAHYKQVRRLKGKRK